jgi:hypothetical protein
MKLDQKAIDSFKLAYQKECGILLENSEATELANRFYTLMDTVYREKKVHYKSVPANFLFTNIN